MDASQNLIIGNQRVNVEAMRTKVEQDIAFLQDRITRMYRQSAPNQVVLETYESMLASRKSVLAWLREHGDAAGRLNTIHKSTG